MTLQKSFLKWAGGKSKLLPILLPHFPVSANRYIEPFLGSGVVLLNVAYENRLGCDSNEHLINTFKIIQSNPQKLIDETTALFEDGNNAERFYELRERFNTSNDPLDRSALFIYLNRHCFNGLCRFNKKGKFNVPFGKYKTVKFPAQEILQIANNIQNVLLHHGDGIGLLQSGSVGDVIYCDPPYLPINDTSYFTDYDTNGFSISDQRRLAQYAKEAANRGATVIISNHDTPLAQEIYGEHIVERIDVQRNISATTRTKAKELIVVYKPL